VFSDYGEPWVINPNTDAITHASPPGFVTGAGTESGIALWDAIGAVIYVASSGAVSVINIDDLAAGWTQLTVSGTFGVSNYPGLDWHVASKKLLAWGHNTNRANLFSLAPPNANPASFSQILGTWTASSHAPAGGNAVTPSSPHANGTHGGFGIWSNVGGSGIDVAVLLNAVTEEPYVRRLKAGGY
jgi:hypothetical protein